MTITTKTGDDGKSRFLGKVVDKDDVLLEMIGELDELMAVIGIVKDEVDGMEMIGSKIYSELYWISGYLAGINREINLNESIKLIENDIKRMEDELKPLHGFLEPGVGLNPKINWARTVTRRVERRMVTFKKSKFKDQRSKVYPNSNIKNSDFVSLRRTQQKSKIDEIFIFLNRLSDYLFIIGRAFG